MAAVAVNDALLEACALQTDIKWPNDLLASERKICGILPETQESSHGRAVILGIGINLKREAFPEELAHVATSISEATGKTVQKEQILSALVRSLTRWYSLLHAEDGPGRILATWKSRSSFAEGKHVKVVNGEEVVCGVTRGLESDGALRVETESGPIISVRAGDVSLRTWDDG
jgi:BirA family biotin operon repressor/biotin-[acetyl-CoA-carboxylase] ligase